MEEVAEEVVRQVSSRTVGAQADMVEEVAKEEDRAEEVVRANTRTEEGSTIEEGDKRKTKKKRAIPEASNMTIVDGAIQDLTFLHNKQNC